MVIQIKTQGQTQPTQPAQPVKSEREAELETMVQNLLDKNYLANLKDDVFFRVELLTSLNQIAMVFKNFLDELKQSQQGEQQ